MKFWQAVTWAETSQLCGIAECAESLGFEGLMSADHALYPSSLSGGYPYSTSGMPPQTGDSEYPDMWTSCAVMAARTSRLKFVCGVYVLPLRNPIEVAKQAATLAILSGGRFVLGIGSGWMKEEFDIYGVPFETRGARMDEMLEIMSGLWGGDWFEYHGQHFDIPKIKVSPTPQSDIPFYFGGDAIRALKRAARLGAGWINTGNTPEEIPPLVGRIQDLRREAGTDTQDFEILCGVYAEPDAGLYRRLEDAGVTATISLPFSMALGERSTLDDKKRFMEHYASTIINAF